MGNVFKALGIQTREDSVSNAIVYAFNQSPTFQRAFLKRICGLRRKYTDCRASARTYIEGAGIPDIVLVCNSIEDSDLVIIENKLKAEEGGDQTKRYADAVCQLEGDLRQKGDIKTDKVFHHFIFLTLFPDQKPSDSRFVPEQHRELIELYDEVQYLPEDKLADRLIRDWVELLRDFYSKERVLPNDSFIDKLMDDEGLDGGYLYFRSFFKSLEQSLRTINLEPRGFSRQTQQGRHYYLVTISKPKWHPYEMEENQGSWSLDPRRVYNIHFEPQFDVLNKTFKLLLHYEVNPYQSESWIEKNIPSHQYNGYKLRRDKFIYALKKQKLNYNWQFTGRTNQIARLDLSFSGYTSQRARDKIEEVLKDMTGAIDNVLKMMYGQGYFIHP